VFEDAVDAAEEPDADVDIARDEAYSTDLIDSVSEVSVFFFFYLYFFVIFLYLFLLLNEHHLLNPILISLGKHLFFVNILFFLNLLYFDKHLFLLFFLFFQII